MQIFHLSSPAPFLLLSLLFLSSFHGHLLVNGQAFDLKNSLTSLQHGTVDSSGTLTLDSSTGDAQAFYNKPIPLLSTITQTVLSFSSFFTFAANASSGNGTIAFVFTTDVAGGLTEARKTLTIEFNTSCATGVFDGSFYGGHGFQGRGGGGYMGGRGRGHFGGLGGFQVIEYAGNTSIAPQVVGGYGPNWNGQPPQDGPYFCSQQTPQDLTNPTFQYQVVVEYNASTDTVWVGSPSCGAGIALTTQFGTRNLSGIITAPVNVGFIVSGGGVFNISQWNFSNNVNSSSVLSLALSSVVDTSPSGNDGNGAIDGGRGHSDGKLKKGYVIGFSILGAAIGVAAVVLACCLCARRRNRGTSARFVAKSVHAGTIPESAVVFDAKKPPPAKVVLVDRDTTPLNTHPNSTFHASTGAASWLQPVGPR